jgi:hypothetical protein
MRRALLASLVLAATLMTAQAAEAAPAASISSSAGPPGTTVTVTGSGFAASTGLDVYLDTTNVAVAATNASGGSSTAVTVPASTQPGAHWITLKDSHSGAAAQVQYFVRTDWPQPGFGAQGRRSNPYENTLNPSNVSGLQVAWASPAGGFANASPFVEYAGYTYVGDAADTIHAYRPSGSLLWSASPGTDMENSGPAEYGSRVFFAGANGTVYAYNYACRTDGGTCTPAWTASVGASAGLTIYNGKLYVPSSDGTIQVLNPASGAASPPITPLGGSGPATTPALFTPEGTVYWARGVNLEYLAPDGSAGNVGQPSTVSPFAYSNGAAYYTTADGVLRTFGAQGWTAAVGSAGCSPAPAVGNGVVFAGSCDHLGAYDSGTGATKWNVATGAVMGLAVANGVVYACTGSVFYNSINAYDATTGARLWTGGNCIGQPIVANGVLYAAYGSLYAYDLTSARSARHGAAHSRRPDPRRLRADPRLHRRHHHTR